MCGGEGKLVTTFQNYNMYKNFEKLYGGEGYKTLVLVTLSENLLSVTLALASTENLDIFSGKSQKRVAS